MVSTSSHRLLSLQQAARACICSCHHPVLIVYRVACLCLHLSSLRVDGLQGGKLCLHLSSLRVDGLQGGKLSVLAPVITPVWMVYRVANCLFLHLSSLRVDGLQGGVSACTCHHSVWMVYRVANCLFLHLSSLRVDGLQGGVSVLAPVITPCGWFTGWLIVCSCICHLINVVVIILSAVTVVLVTENMV